VVASFPHIMLCIQQACCSTLTLCCTGGGLWWPLSLISCTAQPACCSTFNPKYILCRWRFVVASFPHIMHCTLQPACCSAFNPMLCRWRFVVASFSHIMLCIQQACCSTLALCCAGGGLWWSPSLISCTAQPALCSTFNPIYMLCRWRFVVASFPHIMHCTASMLQYRYVISSEGY
jgi:hypothetical protein